MPKKAVLTFKPDGTVEVQDEPGQNAEKNLGWLLGKLGNIERRGHKHAASGEEGITVKQGG